MTENLAGTQPLQTEGSRTSIAGASDARQYVEAFQRGFMETPLFYDERGHPQFASEGAVAKPSSPRGSQSNSTLPTAMEEIGGSHLGRSLIFDTETEFGGKQEAIFGIYELRGLDLIELRALYFREVKGRALDEQAKACVRDKMNALRERGLFYHPEKTTEKDRALMRRWAARHKMRLMTNDAFVHDVLYPAIINKVTREEKRALELTGNQKRPPALVMGWNVPFDFGALVKRWGYCKPTRGLNFGGGFWLQLCSCGISGKYADSKSVLQHNNCDHHPFIKIRKIGRGKHFMATRGSGDGSDENFARYKDSERKGVISANSAFLDVQTLYKCMLEGSSALAKASRNLRCKNPKQEYDIMNDGDLIERGVTRRDLYYCAGDVRATWQSFEKLRDLFGKYAIPKTMDRVYSAASMGKGMFQAIDVRKFFAQHPQFLANPGELVAPFMASYYGGRSEVRYRLAPAEAILCDIKSCYPAVNALEGLQDLLLAKEITVSRDVEAVRKLVGGVKVKHLLRKKTWSEFRTVVAVIPNDDILPVRTKYDAENVAGNIGDNYTTSETPIWMSISDPKQRLAIGPLLSILQRPLVGQKRLALHKKHRKRRQPEIFYLNVAGTPFPCVRKRPAHPLKLLQKRYKQAHPYLESLFAPLGNP